MHMERVQVKDVAAKTEDLVPLEQLLEDLQRRVRELPAAEAARARAAAEAAAVAVPVAATAAAPAAAAEGVVNVPEEQQMQQLKLQ